MDTGQTVIRTLAWLKPNVFANGGDRTSGNIPEVAICNQLGIKMVFGVGGTKFNQAQL